MIDQAFIIHLRRIEPARNMHRFYRLSISVDLFGHTVVLRQWGRIGTRGQEKAEFVADLNGAYLRLSQIESSKRIRGYS
ncbi:WGR domain-containing protein [Agrobacterium sp. ES01]|uniref:WGR domain-containing protein n=1 Tax=Agrobacterium sp. ES01 TaxID=3420714 RepID=UPI003D141B8E